MRTQSLAASTALLAVASTLHAQTHIYVDDDAPTGGDGLNWHSALNDLQAAITLARDLGDSRGEIRIAGGRYAPGQNSAYHIQPTPTHSKPYSLQGGYAGLALPGAPDTRDVGLYPSIIDGDTNSDDDQGNTADNAYLLLVIEDGYFSAGAPVSAAILNGLTFRAAVDSAIRTAHGSSYVTLTDCTIERTGSMTDYALLFQDDFVTVTRCKFKGNQSGAVLANDTELLIEDSMFEDNAASLGGAIHAFRSDLEILDSEFIQNSASSEGGAIYSERSDALIEQCLFRENIAGSSGSTRGYGGAIRHSRDIWDIRSSTFENNSGKRGGAIYADGTAQYDDLTMIGNTATFDGGAIYVSDVLHLSNSAFSQNSAEEGGAIYGNPMTLTSSTFAENSAEEGGAIYGSGAFTDCSFTANVASDGAIMRNTNRGGAIHVDRSTLITRCDFDQNAAGYGGAVWANFVLPYLTIEDSTFTRNFAASQGGAVHGADTIVNTQLTENTAKGLGGAICNTRYIADAYLAENAANSGGAVYGAIEIVTSVLELNHANHGGAVYVSTSRTTSIRDSVLFDNTGVSASLIYAVADFDLIRCTATQTNPLTYTPLIVMFNNLGWIESSIVWDRRPTFLPPIVVRQNASLGLFYSNTSLDEIDVWDHLGAELVLLGGNIDRDPQFVDVNAGDLRLLSGSQCIDAGLLPPNANLPLVDPLGDDRIAYDDRGTPDTGFGVVDHLDIGAFEFRGATCLPDINRDTLLTPADFTAWINAYNTQNPTADQNRDGYVDQGDFTAWIHNYTNGCP